jgi:hypothetical protein
MAPERSWSWSQKPVTCPNLLCDMNFLDNYVWTCWSGISYRSSRLWRTYPFCKNKTLYWSVRVSESERLYKLLLFDLQTDIALVIARSTHYCGQWLVWHVEDNDLTEATGSLSKLMLLTLWNMKQLTSELCYTKFRLLGYSKQNQLLLWRATSSCCLGKPPLLIVRLTRNAQRHCVVKMQVLLILTLKQFL